jgi:hypothetical protein
VLSNSGIINKNALSWLKHCEHAWEQHNVEPGELTQIVDEIKKSSERSHNETREYILSALKLHEEQDEHTWVRMKVDQERRRREIWDKVKGNVIFWLLAGLTSTLGLWVWEHTPWGKK